MNNKTFLFIALILILVAVFSLISYMPIKPNAAMKISVTDFPKTIGEWVSKDIPLDERVYALLETKNLIMRNYLNKQGEAVNCYIIYSQDNRKVAHPPEICLQGEGATVVEKTAMQVTDSIKATKLVLEKPLSRDLVIYWYKAGNLNTNDYIKQQLKIVINRMLRKSSSGALIRISTEIKGDNQDKALSLIQSFAIQIEPLIQKYAP